MAKVRLIGPLWAKDAGDRVLDAATAETLKFGKGLIQSLTPVRSGDLQAGWQTDKSTIYNEVPYCRYVDEGTSRMEGRFMTQRSIPQIEAYYVGAIQKQVRRQLE